MPPAPAPEESVPVPEVPVPVQKEPAPAPEQPAPAPSPAKGGASWDDFKAAFDSSAHEPFPPIEVAEAADCDFMESLLSDPSLGIAALLSGCRDADWRRSVAREFLAANPDPGDDFRRESVLMEADGDTTYWVAGDIHARVSAIAKTCAFIADRRRRGLTKAWNTLILLGDYIDRGDEALETLAFIESISMHPLFEGFKVVALKGNHDEGLFRRADGAYASMVKPAETADFLNSAASAGEDVDVEADAAMRLAKISPRMCELSGIDPDDPKRTILFVHGGVPHVDLQKELYALRSAVPQGVPFFEALSGAEVPGELRRACAEDFTWVRFARDIPEKRPNRGSRGCEIGTRDVARYLCLHRVLTSRDVTFVFRGHDHERAGFACLGPHPVLNPAAKKFAQRWCNVLTLNSMEPDRSSGGMFKTRDIALAEWTPGGSVALHRILTRHICDAPPPPAVSAPEAPPAIDGKPETTECPAAAENEETPSVPPSCGKEEP